MIKSLSLPISIFLCVLSCANMVNAQVNKKLFQDEKGIKEWLQKNNIPACGIGVIREGKLKQVNVYGELQKNVPAPYNTIFKIASLTKPITAMVVLKLVSLGKWQLDEPLYNYWVDPDIEQDARHTKLTTRLLLSHQSGFPNWRYLTDIKKLEFQFDPGTAYQYSGEGFEYLRKALEKKFNIPLEKLADSLLFTPLGMKDTYFYWSDEVDESRYAIGHDSIGKPLPVRKYKKANAAGNVLTTIEDYGKFLAYLLQGGGLSEELFNDMTKQHVETKKGVYFGLGWEIFSDLGNGEYALQHTGTDPGVRTIAILLPKSKQGLIVFTNSTNGMNVWEKIIKEYLGETGNALVKKNLR